MGSHGVVRHRKTMVLMIHCVVILLWCSADFLRAVKQNNAASIEDLVFPEGYPLERHVARTEDGYNLALYRIPHGRTDNATRMRPVVYLQHGLLDTCAAFLVNGPSNALGFILVENGFDVWLGNTRGNTYSNYALQTEKMGHDEFWDFSLDEIARYDLPAFVEYVLTETGVDRLVYIGYSQGTAAAHALFSTRHPITERISLAIMLSPVAFVKHITSHFLKGLVAYDVDDMVSAFGYKQFLPSLEVFHKIGGPFCRTTGFACADIFSLLYGYNPSNIDPSRWEVYLKYAPAGASVKLMIHWTQGVRNRDGQRFQMYDYGTRCWDCWRMKRLQCNRNMYQTRLPPEYNLSQIQVPMVYYAGGHDAVADMVDVMNLKDKLAPGVLVEDHVELDYTHLDLIVGMDAVWRIYPHIIATLKHWTKENIDLIS